jgi:hypothetical protein
MSWRPSDETKRAPQAHDGIAGAAPVGTRGGKDDGGFFASMRNNNGPVPGSLLEAIRLDPMAFEEQLNPGDVIVAHDEPSFRAAAAALRSARPSREVVRCLMAAEVAFFVLADSQAARAYFRRISL